MTMAKTLAWLCVLLALAGEVGSADEAASPKDDLALWLDFEKVVDDQFVCVATGAACRTSGQPMTQQGALQAASFNEVFVPEVAGFVGDRQLTVSVWVAPQKPPQSYQTLLYKGKRKGPTLQQIHFSLCLCDGRPEFKFKDEAGAWKGILRNGPLFFVPGQSPIPVTEVPSVACREWSHVAATFDSGRIRIYLNGSPILSGDCPVQKLVPNDHPLRIAEGESETGHRAYLCPGLIDDVRIHNRALTADQIASLYDRDRAQRPAGQITIRPFYPPGYDPEFKTKLPLVAAYEKDLPPRPTRKQITSCIKAHGGVPTLHIDDKPVYAMAMMPEPYVSDDQISLSCRDFAATGMNIYSEIFWSWMQPQHGCHGWWLGPGRYDFEKVDGRIRAILAADPQALIFPRIKLNPPAWWLKTHPDEIAQNADGTSGQQASLASEAWEEAYGRMLRDVVRHMESSDYAGHIIGYHPAGGGSSEWFWWGKTGQVDYCPAARRRFRTWVGERYHGDVAALRHAWGDDTLTLDLVERPSMALRQATEHRFFRHPRTARPVIDYRIFLSDMVSRNIIRSCKIVKEETGGRKFAGVFYGYSSYCTTQNGFQGLAPVLASPDVDFLCAPTAYDYRRGGEPGSLISTYNGSYRLHNKLYWDEVDTRTHLCTALVHYRTARLEETVSVLQRSFGYSLTKGTGLWWFLLAGNATFHQAEVMDAIAEMKRAGDTALEADRSQIHDVAVFIDEPSMHYTNSKSNPPLRLGLLRKTLDELACMGAPYDTYLLSDLTHRELPNYKLYIFLNAFRIDAETRAAIDAKVKGANKTAAWVYAPGYVGEDGFSTDNMTALTGMTFQVHDESIEAELALTDATHVVTSKVPPHHRLGWSVGPVFSVDDPAAVALGRTGEHVSLAVREMDDWHSVYSMLPLSRELLLGLCRYAGVHVYSETFDPFSASRSFVMIHTASAGSKHIVLPGKHDVVNALSGQLIGEGIREIEETLPEGVTRIYRITPR
jgi:concanavalin A-like lectin/glucanase superfamily protein/glycosyl hydrolase family 42 (putative beta-galactosidase)